jgi:hypothetical protein
MAQLQVHTYTILERILKSSHRPSPYFNTPICKAMAYYTKNWTQIGMGAIFSYSIHVDKGAIPWWSSHGFRLGKSTFGLT